MLSYTLILISMKGLLIFASILLVLGGLVVWYMNMTVNSLPEQSTFEKNSFYSESFPYGDHIGTTTSWYKGSWIGKGFSEEDDTGINIYQKELSDTHDTKYPFIVREGKSLEDTTKKVIVLDYNVPENSYWLRFLREEIVELPDGSYLGKTLFVVIPQVPIDVSFFTLEK